MLVSGRFLLDFDSATDDHEIAVELIALFE